MELPAKVTAEMLITYLADYNKNTKGLDKDVALEALDGGRQLWRK